MMNILDYIYKELSEKESFLFWKSVHSTIITERGCFQSFSESNAELQGW